MTVRGKLHAPVARAWRQRSRQRGSWKAAGGRVTPAAALSKLWLAKQAGIRVRCKRKGLRRIYIGSNCAGFSARYVERFLLVLACVRCMYSFRQRTRLFALIAGEAFVRGH